MKARHLIFTFLCLVGFFAAVTAQPHVSFTHGEFRHKAYNPFLATEGTYHFTAQNTDINGKLGPFPGNGVYTLCDGGQPRCIPGNMYTFFENINGISAFYQNNSPVVVDGVTYETMFYNDSSFRAEAAPVRIPWRFSKRKTFKLTIKVHATGNLIGHSPGPSTTVFTGGIDLWGWVTVEFTRDDSGHYPFPQQNYVMTGDAVYTFPAPG